MQRLAVLISSAGTGSNLKSIIHSINTGELKAQISLVVSDNEDAKGVEIAKGNGIKTHILKPGEDLVRLLDGIDFVCLAGWKQVIPDDLVSSFKNKILNIHPGLIPDTLDGDVKNPDGTIALWNKGMFAAKAIQNFLDQNSTYAGSSVHFLSDEFDFGPVLERGFVKIEEADTADSLYERLKKKENEIYVNVLKKLCNGR